MAQDRLLGIAIREFGLKGLDGASTRGIAAAAGTAMSAITYHYGGKDGLYLAAADHVAAGMAGEMAPLLADCSVPPGDPARARVAVHAVIGRFVTKMASDRSADESLFILREQLNPTDAFDRLYAGVMGEMLRCVAMLVAAATGCAPRASRVAAVTLLAQGVAMRASRAAIVRLLEIPTLDEASADEIKARIHANIDAILDRMIAEEPQ